MKNYFNTLVLQNDTELELKSNDFHLELTADDGYDAVIVYLIESDVMQLHKVLGEILGLDKEKS